jgi:hypothetical protein
MLAGFAIENLLKALWCAKGNKLASCGKLTLPNGFRSHQLSDLAREVGFSLGTVDETLLGSISKIMTGIGRYPCGKDGNSLFVSMSDNIKSLQNLIDRLLEAIRREQNKQATSPATA